MTESAGLRFRYLVEHHDLDGNLTWRDEFDNVVTTQGANLLGNIMFNGTTQITTWYLGLKGTGTAAATDTAATHAGWSEVTGYSESVRQTLTLASFSSRTASNASSPAVFTINASVTVAGVFLISNSTKGGTTGSLYSAGDFSGGANSMSSGTLTINAFALSY